MGVFRKWFYKAMKRWWFKAVWALLCISMFYHCYFHYETQPQFYYLRQMLGLGLCVARGTAAVLNFSCFCLLLPMCRALTTALTTGIAKLYKSYLFTLDAFFIPGAKTIHWMIAVTVIGASVVHTVAHLANAVNFSRHFNEEFPEICVLSQKNESPYHILFMTVPGVTGLLMLLILAVLCLTSIRSVRERHYNTFCYAHRLGVLFLIFLIFHPMSCVLKEQTNVENHIPGCTMPADGNKTKDHQENPSSSLAQPQPFSADLKNMEMDRRHKNYKLETEDGHHQMPQGVQKRLEQETHGILRPGYFVLPEPATSSVEETDGRSQTKKKPELNGKGICQHPPKFGPINTSTPVWVTLGLLVWGAEQLWRWWWWRKAVDFRFIPHNDNVIQATFKKTGFSCSLGQYVLVNCPEVSQFEWHPFTVIPLMKQKEVAQKREEVLYKVVDKQNTKAMIQMKKKESQTAPGDFTIYIQVRGDWTGHIVENSHHITKMYVDGPFVSPTEGMMQYPYLIVAAGGMGITPFVATLTHILNSQSEWPKRVHVVWVTRNLQLFKIFEQLLSDLHNKSLEDGEIDHVELKLHFTGDECDQDFQLFAESHPAISSCIQKERPKWEELFMDWELLSKKQTVGVFACGPAGLRREVEGHCLSAIAHGRTFHYHQESFS